MSISTALKARQEALRDDREAGFTLIELLVVVIIIGILAAIAIPVYLGVQNNAKDSAVKSDLTNAKTAIAAYAVEKNGAVPASLSSDGVSGDTPAVDLKRHGWSLSSNTSSLVYTTQGSGSTMLWCVLGTSATGKKWAISSTTALTGGTSTSTCPATY